MYGAEHTESNRFGAEYTESSRFCTCHTETDELDFLSLLILPILLISVSVFAEPISIGVQYTDTDSIGGDRNWEVLCKFGLCMFKRA